MEGKKPKFRPKPVGHNSLQRRVLLAMLKIGGKDCRPTSQAAVAKSLGKSHGGYIRATVQRLREAGLVSHVDGDWFDFALTPAGKKLADELAEENVI